jgi:cellulose biosynthesis protein BcsQ
MHPLIEFFQQNASLFVVLAAVTTVLGVVFTIYQRTHGRVVRFWKDRVAQLERELGRVGSEVPKELQRRTEQLETELAEAEQGARDQQKGQQQNELAWKAEDARLRQIGSSLSEELERAREDLCKRAQQDKTRANLIKRAMKLQGRVWMRTVLQGIPKFRPLNERHVAFVSVLNLKGGVGKTTVTAHLGAALAAKGYRVLLVDLDLQGSLSSLFINESILTERSEEKKLLQHFLTAAAEKRRGNILDCCVPIFDGKSAVIPTSDSMTYAELNLTMQWLLRIGKRDTRFLLRRLLHQRRVTNRFDIVLLDCPPLFNTCCVNALATSDYVIIPMTPSSKVAERVPLLLERLKGLCRVINPELQVVGVLLNRTWGAQLTAWEQDLWRDVLDKGKDQWKLPVPAFETFIRQNTEVRDSENEFTPPAPGSELHTLFSRLVAELEARLPRDCCRTAIAPIGAG